ncbi:hypothetical protein F0562_033251 [Nyssa sinensis]|uniref:Chloroplast sensor kinase, chloroplastic n=1 Tax=Nyssa sinensis TaxID=561372 RepID=A0A5J5ATL9_9ASTE|nr:hypothetical protein F0562_033251 [Nyssa sinensis]
MLLCAITPRTPLCNPHSDYCNPFFLPNGHKLHHHHHHHHHRTFCRANTSALTTNASSSSLANGTSENSLQNPNPRPQMLHHVCLDEANGGGDMVSSASAVASAIREASTSPVEFMQRIENDGKNKGLVLPSSDFQRLCLEQLNLFRRIVDPNALLSVYVRPAGSYVMDRLELRRVTLYPGTNTADIVILIGNFSVPTGLRVAEASLLNQQAEFIPEFRAVVLPMVKHPFVVGFLVAELPKMELEREGLDVKHFPFPEEPISLPPCTDTTSWDIQTLKDNTPEVYKFTAEQRLNAINISRSLAMAYVMDQKAMLLQQSSWQNNVRMSNLVEQIRGPLSSIRTLSKMLSVHMKRSEISHDIVENILVQGDLMNDTLQQLQDAVYLTKANILRYNEETLKKHHSIYAHPESMRSQLSNNFSRETSISDMQESGGPLSISSATRDLQMPMPPLALRTCTTTWHQSLSVSEDHAMFLMCWQIWSVLWNL